MEDARKNKGDLAVSWLEQDKGQLHCALRIVFDGSAANHFPHPGSPVPPASAGSHGTMFPVEPRDYLHCGQGQQVQLP